ncbi:hypothetical protein [Actinomadura chokoriensis]
MVRSFHWRGFASEEVEALSDWNIFTEDINEHLYEVLAKHPPDEK